MIRTGANSRDQWCRVDSNVHVLDRSEMTAWAHHMALHWRMARRSMDVLAYGDASQDYFHQVLSIHCFFQWTFLFLIGTVLGLSCLKRQRLCLLHSFATGSWSNYMDRKFLFILQRQKTSLRCDKFKAHFCSHSHSFVSVENITYQFLLLSH